MSSRTFIRLANRAIVGLAVSALRRQPAYERSDTALLLIGPQPDLLHDAATVCALTRLLTAFRAAGVPVIYAVAASPSPDNGIQFPTPSQRAILDDGLLNPGTIGAEIHPELAPKPGDLILAPHATLSAFAKTSLARRLSEAGTRRIVVAGARTDVEIDSTARDAAELGFQTTVFADGCIGTSTQTHRASISTTLPRIVHGVLGLDEITHRLRLPARQHQAMTAKNRMIRSSL